MRRWMARTVGVGAVALTLTGCADFPAMPMPYAYAPPRTGYAPSFARRSYAFQRPVYVPRYAYAPTLHAALSAASAGTVQAANRRVRAAGRRRVAAGRSARTGN